MDKYVFKPKKKMCDLLIVVDERDMLKKQMHNIREVLSPVRRWNQVKVHSIYDPDEEKRSIWCDKVLILMEESSNSCIEETWVSELPNIQGDPSKFLILYLRDNLSAQRVPTGHRLQDNMHIFNIRDVFYWFLEVLQFLNEGKIPVAARQGKRDICLCQLEIVSNDARSFSESALDFLAKLNVIEGNIEEETDAKTIVILGEFMDQEIGTAVKDRLRRGKLKGCHVYFLSFNGRATVPEDINWCCSRVYTRMELMRFMVHMLDRSGLITTGLSKVNDLRIHPPLRGPVRCTMDSQRNSILLEWPVQAELGSKQFIKIDHRSQDTAEWETLIERLPIESTTLQVNDVAVGNQHEFHLHREAASGSSTPLTAYWPPKIVMKYFLCVAAIVAFLLEVPLFLITLIEGLIYGLLTIPLIIYNNKYWLKFLYYGYFPGVVYVSANASIILTILVNNLDNEPSWLNIVTLYMLGMGLIHLGCYVYGEITELENWFDIIPVVILLKRAWSL